MADLLIRGRKLPKYGCAYCFLRTGNYCGELSTDESVVPYSRKFERHPDCPLVEVPDHGPLGDLAEIWKLLEEEKYPETQIANEKDNDDRYWMIGKNAGVNAFRRVCQNLQTIIPASKEGES